MTRLLRATFGLFATLLLLTAALTPGTALAQDGMPLFTQDFPPSEFAERRANVFDRIGTDAIVVLQGEPTPRGYTRFRQSNEFYYLTGIEVAHALLIMDGASRTTTLYLPHRNEGRERSEGHVLSAEDATLVRELSGMDRVAATEQFAEDLGRQMRRRTVPTLYTLFQPAEGLAESRDLGLRHVSDRLSDPWDGRPSREAHFMSLIAERYPTFHMESINPILDDLRLIKSPREMEIIRKATRLSGIALMEAMRSVAPGQKEMELDAVAKYHYWRNGAQGDAYYSLVASAGNAYYPHYNAGQRTMQDGDFLLMDYAPDVEYYMSDVTRMMPVNGTFNTWQRELYGFYLGAYRAVLLRIRPGVTPNQIMREAVVEMRQMLDDWTFSKDIYRAAAESYVNSYEQRATRDGATLGHGVGMATHDVGDYSGVLQAGMVFTIEPALRVPEEQIYIRLEDLIIIHEDRAEIVSDFVPMDIDAIEAWMAQDGILQAFPDMEAFLR
ncbi:MAG: Xaa-Pro peptidase family protein [Rhodothermales bacterium]